MKTIKKYLKFRKVDEFITDKSESKPDLAAKNPVLAAGDRKEPGMEPEVIDVIDSEK